MMRPHHSVKFYDDETFLSETVSPFVRAGLLNKGTAIAVVTPEHRAALENDLVPGFVASRGNLLFLDGRDTLDRFMVNGRPSRSAFCSIFENLLREAAEQGPVSIFGEMVAILWSDGKRQAALDLESLWNDLAARHQFSLLCAYPLSGFRGDQHHASFLDVCGTHSRIILTSSCRSDPSEQPWSTA